MNSGLGDVKTARQPYTERVTRPYRIGVTSALPRGADPGSNFSQHVEHIERAGGSPVILWREPETLASLQDGHLDGLLLTGGGDVSPERSSAVTELI